MATSRRVSSVLLCGFAAAAACGAEAGIDPCRLVTPSEVQAALGSPIRRSMEAPRSPGRPVRICNFASQNGRSVSLYVGPKGRAEFDEERKGHEAVPGIGDAAYGISPGMVSFRKGSTSVLVQTMPSDAVEFEKVKALARSAAGRV